MQEKVSVIMSTYREKLEWIELSVNSILNQSYKNIEFIIVVDDPERSDIVSKLNEFRKFDNRIKLIINENNQGLVYSLNRALREVSSDYVLRMDADDVAHEKRIEKQLEFMNIYDLDLVGCQVTFINEEGNIMFNTSSSMHVKSKYIYQILNFQNCIYHPTWLVRTELYKKLGGYRNINYCEDFDFLLRAKNCGAKLSNLNMPLVLYRYNTSGISRLNKSKQRCITKFMCSQRKNIENIDENEINMSVKNEKLLADCEKYYEFSQKAIDEKVRHNYGGMLFYCLKCIFFTKNGRKKLFETLWDKVFFVIEKFDMN